MQFRPCIDIHDGKVKQIVGGSLRDEKNNVVENFVANQDASYFADLYKGLGLKGGHIILLNKAGTEEYEATKKQAIGALQSYPNGLQVGGGITPDNAKEFIDAGASHVIVTSYVFSDGKLHMEKLQKLVDTVGKENLVLDLSCKKKENGYVIVTDRWQNETDFVLTHENLDYLASFCDEFLIHAVDVEGKMNGVEEELVTYLGQWGKIPVTYAGGVHSFDDIEVLKEKGRNKLDVTVGSALDLFGGNLVFTELLEYMKCDV